MSLQSTTASQVLTIAAGGAATLQTDDYAVAVLVKRPSHTNLWMAYKADNFSKRGVGISSGDLFHVDASDLLDANLLPDTWYWVVTTKPDATSPVRHHWAEYEASGALTWNHGDLAGAQVNDGNINRICIGDPFGTGFQGEIVAIAAWTDELDDSTIEATFARSASTIFDATPALFVLFPEASAEDPVVDEMGGPGEMSRTAGWSVSADPTNFDFALGGPPANQPPTVDGGPNRSVLVGQAVTLAATAEDEDGTVASVLWVQLSGPAATLGGSGATRNFTPTEAGTYIFGVTATDDDGDSSAVDQVIITVTTPPPVAFSGKMRPFGSMERAVMSLIKTRGLVDIDGNEIEVPDEQVGGDFGYDPDAMPWYIRIDRVPGGSSDRLQGDFVIDLEVFGSDYLLTESVAYALEALVLGYPHVVEVEGRKVVFDDVTQNVGPADLPWEDDSTHRLGATYVITARRR